MSLQDAGMSGLAIRYADMKAIPRETLWKIFEYCGLPITSMEAVYRVLEKDSQAGSGMSQEALSHKKSGLTDAQRADCSENCKPIRPFNRPILSSQEHGCPQHRWDEAVIRLAKASRGAVATLG